MLAELGLVAINEAFAAQVLGGARQLGVVFDDPRRHRPRPPAWC
jgi:acetyl-CoA C-acetyltransferase